MSDPYITAREYYSAGLNIIPVKTDGSKKPKIRWQRWETEKIPWQMLEKWFAVPSQPSGIGIVCGMTSGGLEVLDFDDYRPFPLFHGGLIAGLFGAITKLPVVRTPDDGRHIYYRCAEVGGNQILAQDKAGNILVETRGQGGMVVAPGSPLATHPTGKPYRLDEGDLLNIPVVSPEQRQRMLDFCRGFNTYVAPPKPPKPERKWHHQPAPSRACSEGLRPGDDFNRRATWEEILEPHGWTALVERGETTYWRKPGSDGNEHHATTNYGGTDLLYIFSTSLDGFTARMTYDKFAAYAILACGGDFKAAAKKLACLGYGQPNTPDDSILDRIGKLYA